jgi:hypothetical protein
LRILTHTHELFVKSYIDGLSLLAHKTEIAQTAETAIKAVEKHLLRGFPAYIHDSVKAGLIARLKNI